MLDLTATLINFQRSSSRAPAFVLSIPSISALVCEALRQSLHLLKGKTLTAAPCARLGERERKREREKEEKERKRERCEKRKKKEEKGQHFGPRSVEILNP